MAEIMVLMANSLDPDQGWYVVGPDLDKKLFAKIIMQMTKSPVNIFHIDKEPATVFQQRVVLDKQTLKILVSLHLQQYMMALASLRICVNLCGLKQWYVLKSVPCAGDV